MENKIYFGDDPYHRFARTRHPRKVLRTQKNAWNSNSSDYSIKRDKTVRNFPFNAGKPVLASASDSVISYNGRAKTTRIPTLPQRDENRERESNSRGQIRKPVRILTARSNTPRNGISCLNSLKQRSIEFGPSPERHLSNRYERPKTGGHNTRQLSDQGESVRRPHTSPHPRSRASLRRGVTYASSPQRVRGEPSPDKETTQQGEIEIKLQVQDIDLATPHDSDLVTALSDKVLALYNHVTSQEEVYISHLNENSPTDGLIYKKIKIGSVLLIAECRTLEALDLLEAMYVSSELNQLLNDTFVSEQLLDELGVKSLSLNTTIRQTCLEKCRDDLLIKEMMDDEHLQEEQELYVSRADCARKLKELWDSFRWLQTTITNQYNYFLSYINDFFMVLKLSKPVSMKNFDCLEDVLRCYNFLSSSHSVGKSVRTDLVREYLDIVNRIKQGVKSLFVEISQWEKHLFKYITPSCLGELKKSIKNINMILSPKKRFDTISFFVVLKVSVLDRQIFGGLIKYIPALLAAFSVIEGELGTLKSVLAYDQGSETTAEPDLPPKQQSTHAMEPYSDPVDALVHKILTEAQKQVRFLLNDTQTKGKETTSHYDTGFDERRIANVNKEKADTQKQQPEPVKNNKPQQQQNVKAEVKVTSREPHRGKLSSNESTTVKFSNYMGLISKLKTERHRHEPTEYHYGKERTKEGKGAFPLIHGRSIPSKRSASNVSVDTNSKLTSGLQRPLSRSSVKSSKSVEENCNGKIATASMETGGFAKACEETPSISTLKYADRNPSLYDLGDEEHRVKRNGHVTSTKGDSTKRYIVAGLQPTQNTRRVIEVSRMHLTPRANTRSVHTSHDSFDVDNIGAVICPDAMIDLVNPENRNTTALPPVTALTDGRSASPSHGSEDTCPGNADILPHSATPVMESKVNTVPSCENGSANTTNGSNQPLDDYESINSTLSDSGEELLESLQSGPSEIDQSEDETLVSPSVVVNNLKDGYGDAQHSLETPVFIARRATNHKTRLNEFSLEGFGLSTPPNTPKSSMIFNTYSGSGRAMYSPNLGLHRRSSVPDMRQSHVPSRSSLTDVSQSSIPPRSAMFRTPKPDTSLVITPQSIVSGRSSATSAPCSAVTRRSSAVSAQGNTWANRQRVVSMANSLHNKYQSPLPRERINHDTTTLKSASTERYRDEHFSEIIKPCKRSVRFNIISAQGREHYARDLSRDQLKSAPLPKRTDPEARVHLHRQSTRNAKNATVPESSPDFHHESRTSDKGSLISLQLRNMARRDNSALSRRHSEKDAGTSHLSEKDAGTSHISEKDAGASHISEEGAGTSHISEERDGDFPPHFKVVIRKDSQNKRNSEANVSKNYEYVAVSNLATAVSNR